MNVVLRGRINEILKSMVEEGYANTKSEAIRLAIMSFGKEYFSREELLVNRKLDMVDEQIKKGKRKLLSAEEALGEHSKHLE